MNPLLLILLSATLTFQVNSNYISPRDLTDQANEQLQNLESIVQADITVAHNNLRDLLFLFLINSSDNLEKGEIAIEQEHQTVIAQITTLEDLAMSAGKDVTTCTAIREQVLDGLPAEYSKQMRSCMDVFDNQVIQIVRDATYIVDVNINKVHNLQFQLVRCQGEILCITTIVTQVEQYMVSLPQAIQMEVNSVKEDLETLSISTKQCSDQEVADYAAEATAILREIETCVNRILD